MWHNRNPLCDHLSPVGAATAPHPPLRRHVSVFSFICAHVNDSRASPIFTICLTSGPARTITTLYHSHSIRIYLGDYMHPFYHILSQFISFAVKSGEIRGFGGIKTFGVSFPPFPLTPRTYLGRHIERRKKYTYIHWVTYMYVLVLYHILFSLYLGE